VNPKDEDAIGAVLLRTVGDEVLRAELRRRGRARAADFTWARTAQATLRAYEQVLD